MNGISIKCVILLCVLNVAVCRKRSRYDKLWKKYLKDFDKHYDEKEEAIRRKSWQENMREIEEHNEEFKHGSYKYSMGENDMTDWTEEEMSEYLSCLRDSRSGKADDWDDGCDKQCQHELPEHVDWREEHVITPVKNQRQCGSCWAFSTTGALEAHNALKTGKLIELSEQELVDCSIKYRNRGCKGGLPQRALDYIIANKGLNTEEKYPYEAKKESCRETPEANKAAVSSYIKLKTHDEKYLQAIVARHGPVIGGIHANHKLMKYKHGVFHDPDCPRDRPNHSILIVGYGVFDDTPYWLIKNSWGPHWGMEGYVMLPRNNDSHCSISTRSVLPMM